MIEPLAIGIDIGGTNLRFALVDASGRIRHRIRTVSQIGQGRDAFCRRLLDGITEIKAASDDCCATVIGVGAGVPGLVDKEGVIRSSVNMRPLDGFNLSAYLEQQTGLPSACCNDATLIARGEHVFGAARGLDSFIVITIGTGLGSGLVLNRQLWGGAGGFAAEFGHVTVEPEGLPCPCGNRGCLEQYVSAGAVVRFLLNRLNREQLDTPSSPMDARQIALLARQGHVSALAAFADAGRYLGIALASLTNTLNLQAAVLCGGVSASLDLMQPALQHEIATRCFPQIAADFSIISGTLGDDAGILGAAAMMLGQVPNRGELYG
ncbi:MAG: ROK family protein [Desulfuromonadales bacterium]|nr:ROK family protein [Desulfuromonadales bacterium]